MLEYYEPLSEAAERLGIDGGWLRRMCKKERITPHAVRFEDRWFLPKDAELLGPKEKKGETRDYIEG